MAELVRKAAAVILQPLHGHEVARPTGDGEPLELDFGAMESLAGGILHAFTQEGEELLGLYQHMVSPGRITLFGDALQRFFWALIHRLGRAGHRFWKQDLEALAHLTAFKTWTHEQFHLFADIQRHLSGGAFRPDRLLEEALACAHSWRQVHQSLSRTPLSRIHPSQLRPFLLLAYDYGKLSGYSDWPQYDSQTTFQGGLLRLFDRPEHAFLEASGVPVATLLTAQLPHLDEVRVVEALG